MKRKNGTEDSFDTQKSGGLLVGYLLLYLDEKGPLRCDGYLEQDSSDVYCLLGCRTDNITA